MPRRTNNIPNHVAFQMIGARVSMEDRSARDEVLYSGGSGLSGRTDERIRSV